MRDKRHLKHIFFIEKQAKKRHIPATEGTRKSTEYINKKVQKSIFF